MNHRKGYRKLNRATDQRIALLRSLAIALFKHNQIKTTLPKAKEARKFAERLITLAKRGDLAARRRVIGELGDPNLVRHLFDEIAGRFQSREGGYTRIIHAGRQRGDNTQMAILELTE